jgi:hypothetical protein
MKPNQELLPKENFITLYFSIIVQIHKKIRGQEAMVSSVQTGLKDLRIFRHANSRICLHFWKFNIFFNFGRWCTHVNQDEKQYFVLSLEYSLSSLVQ